MPRTVKATVSVPKAGWGLPDPEGMIDVTIKTTKTRPSRTYVLPLEPSIAQALDDLGEFDLYLTSDGQPDPDRTIMFALPAPPDSPQEPPTAPQSTDTTPAAPHKPPRRSLRSLEEHENTRTPDAAWDRMPTGKNRLSGVACPRCKAEMRDCEDETIRIGATTRPTIAMACTSCDHTCRRKL